MKLLERRILQLEARLCPVIAVSDNDVHYQFCLQFLSEDRAKAARQQGITIADVIYATSEVLTHETA